MTDLVQDYSITNTNMLPGSKRRLTIVLTHILVWAVFGLAIFFRAPVFSGIDISYQLWITQTLTLALLVIVFYINTVVLVPRLLLKHKPVYYFVSITALLAIIVFVNGWGETMFPLPAAESFPPKLRPLRLRPFGLNKHLDTLTVIISVLVMVIGTGLTMLQKWQQERQSREALEKERASSELSFLKAQINPHFFFNTLNNIYALTKIDAHKAGEAIHELSRMMRYLIYETQQGQTMLSQELKLMQHYISLMQLRLTPMVQLTVELPAQLADTPLAPMILLPFIENAFKHGVSTTQPSHIDIGVKQRGSQLDLIVKNSIIQQKDSSLDSSSGIGLQNTRRRLDLLYPGNYTLEINALNAANEYTVHLMLVL